MVHDIGLDRRENRCAAVQKRRRSRKCTLKKDPAGTRAGTCLARGDCEAIKRRSISAHAVRGRHQKRPVLYQASQLLNDIIGVGGRPTKRSWAATPRAHEGRASTRRYLKERTTYEIIDPKTVGVPSAPLVLSKHSGRHALPTPAAEAELGVTARSRQ